MAMGLEFKNGCRLGCIALLFASCLSFQTDIPRIPLPSPGLKWRFPKGASPKSERSHSKVSSRTWRHMFPYDPSSTSNFPMMMSNETSSDSNNDLDNNISVNGNGIENANEIVTENNNFVQNRTNNIKIEENIEEENKVETKKVSFTLDVSKHYFDEMEDRSGKDYRWIKPLTKPVSHVMMKDIERRSKVYLSDWTDGFKNWKKVIPAVLFLYFACLSPAISFGTIASQITNDSIGVVEFLLSAGFSGMVYSIICGQPMAFIAPTGLTLAFISGLFRFCTLKGLPFFPVYAWVGLWTSGFFTFLGLGGSSQLIRYCTRFTDEIFNSLLSITFIYEAVVSIRRNFQQADPTNLTTPFVALAMALSTYKATEKAAAFESSKFLNQRIRRFVKNFGPVIIFCAMSGINSFPGVAKFTVPTLSVPNHFQLAGGRKFLVAINSIPNKVKLLCSLPAMLLTSLFFMDQNISVRVVNNPDNKLKKGPAYNLDMVALGLITGVLSVLGLPWMCGATVQSMNHVKALTDSAYNPETEEIEIVDVTETRLTGFLVHALIAGSLLLLPVVRLIPIPVVSGVFLFLGRKLMKGNSFLQRIRDTFVEDERLLEDNPIRMVGRKRTGLFTAIQILCLMGLWGFKENPSTAIFFPSAIGMLMVIRIFVLPKIFNEEELVELGDPTPLLHLDDGVI